MTRSVLLRLLRSWLRWTKWRPASPRHRYEALGALPPTWRPVARTIVRTNHLPRY
jgi:hypothetical protein